MDTPTIGSADVDPVPPECSENEHMYSVAMQHAANPMFIAHRSGKICWVNDSFIQLYGYSADEMLGKTPRVLKSGRQTPEFYRDLWRTISAGNIWRGQLTNRKKGGELFDVEQTITPLRTSTDRVDYYLAVYEDITQRLRSEQNIARLALFDSLTGLPNRNQFLRRSDIASSRARRAGKSFGVMLADLDHFKAVNDTLGHAAGDELLVQVAQRMQASIRDTDMVSRLSGDEFAILLEDLSRPEQAVESAQRLLDAIQAPYEIMGHPVHVGLSMGIALSGNGDANAEQLLHNADLAMYQAKAGGRGQFQFFDAAMDAAARQRYNTEASLKGALRDDKLFLVFQPQVNLRSGSIVGAEALIRWNDPERGMIPSLEFVTLAEQTGMIFALNDWVLRHAFQQISEWVKQGHPLVPISINISAGQFDRVGFCDTVRGLLKQYAIPPRLIRFEITESVILKPSNTVNQNLQALSRYGIRIGVDDFGTGYSSLPSLREFAIDYIKLDTSYVQGIGHSAKEEQLLRAIIGIAHTLGMHMIAEGIERQEHVDFLLKESCSDGQGFLFSRGIPAAEFIQLLRAGPMPAIHKA